MSLWILKKDGNKSRVMISVGIPFQAILIMMGILSSFIAKSIINYPILTAAWISIFLGFILFVSAKVSLFRRGIWISWGSKQMPPFYKRLYLGGYALMFLGIMLILQVRIVMML